jgi:hypothetical protein
LSNIKHIGLGLSRLIIGSLFLFSGFVKGIDPIGLQYKLADYLEALHLNLFSIFVPAGSLILPLAEFAIGLALLLGCYLKYATKATLGFMFIFTPLTLYIALKNPVTDCGCFGDALVITNWQTFYKNIILLSLAFWVHANWSNLTFQIPYKVRNILSSAILISYLGIVYWSYRHEPVIDFRPYKLGVNISEGMSTPAGAAVDVYQNSYRYKNRKTNEIKKFGDLDYPWNDTINWKFESMDVSLLLKKGYHPPIHDFSIQNNAQQDLTEYYLKDTTLTFIVINYDLEKSNHRYQGELNRIANWSKQNQFHFIGLTSTSGDALKKYRDLWHPTYEILFSDQTTLKTIIRSNPGLILLSKGTVMGKWAAVDLPNDEQILSITKVQMKKKLNH